ncbi:MAG TPA: preprotein translocase subunit SecG [Lacibacter sp.]|nr:preprotein translocase subunit SecG [Lacibacter sp.]
MTVLFIILVVLASALLGFVVLVQNPKGGGLSGSIGGFNTQFMGVKQTTDVLEKGTWIFAGIVGILCLFSSFFLTGTSSSSVIENVPTRQTAPAPQQQAPQNTTTPAQPAK